ncbi:MAG TPA: nucleotidyltransferase domain-containing protein [Pseudobacteroides sp.]|nr:nucleotidyltransferase domain-containing protein [Pseudobacteroides sp.]
MRVDWLENDRVINRVDAILEACANSLGIEIMSIVLYGSKARGDRNSQNDYEFVILVNNNTSLSDFIKLQDSLKIQLLKEKLLLVKVIIYTPEIFEDVLYSDKVTGTLLYMICKENIIIYDKYGTFISIKERLSVSNIKKEEDFLVQCVEFARMLGSQKWERKWEKTLMQYRYMKRRREI